MGTQWKTGYNHSVFRRVMMLVLVLSLVVGLMPNTVLAAAGVGGQSFSLSSGQYIRQVVSVDRGEAVVAHLIPISSSEGSTRIEAYLDGRRVDRVSGRRDEVVRLALPPDVAAARASLELRYMCRTRTGRGTAQWVRSTRNESPAPIVSVYVNQRSFLDRSGVCKDENNRTVTDGLCMCSDASAAMALTLGVDEDVSDARNIASSIFESTAPARRPYGGGQIVSELIDAIEDLSDYRCRETRISSSSFEQTLKNAVRLGDPVLFRSRGFSNAGHYVSVIGYKQNGSDIDLHVNDPFGRWVRKNQWSLNSTSAGSSRGNNVTYRLSSLRSDASVIVCTP